MEQALYEGLWNDFKGQVSSIADVEVTVGEAGKPIVVLVHGIGGNAKHWADPISLSVGETWLFNVEEEPPSSAKGLVPSPVYKPEMVVPWTKVLSNGGATIVNFSQGHPTDLIQFAVDELVIILKAIEGAVFAPYEAAVASNGGSVPPLVILAHSRGGLVTRYALKGLGKAGVPHLRKLITLCTPHLGSYLPDFADDYDSTLHTQLEFRFAVHVPVLDLLQRPIEHWMTDLVNKVREALKRSSAGIAQAPGFDELDPNSEVFKALGQDEQPFEGVSYHAYGGSNPNFLNYYLVIMGQQFKVMPISGSHLMELFSKVVGLDKRYGGLEELNKGDSMVSLSSSHFPPPFKATHQVFPINHMQALVDGHLQVSVIMRIYGE